jgi:demethylspheroidene O-methyltransferase
VWRKHWRTWRNRILANPRFVAAAERLPIARFVARRRAKSLFDLVAGFSYAQTLFACVELGLIEKVGLEGTTLQNISQQLGWPSANTDRLIGAAVALDLFERDGDGVFLGQQGTALLAQPWIMRFISHHKHFAEDLIDPVALLSGTRSKTAMRRYWDYENPASDASAYSRLMEASQEAVSRQILQAYDFSGAQSVVDLGGGTGAFLRALGARYPALQRTLVDRAAVIEIAKADPRNAGITSVSADVRSDELPSADTYMLIRVVHDHDDADILALLKNIRRQMRGGSTLVIAEPFAGNPTTASVTDAYFNLYFAAMGQGRTRKPDEIFALARQAGYGRWTEHRTMMPLISGLMQVFPE